MEHNERTTVIPAPGRIRRLTGAFTLTSNTKILTQPDNEALLRVGSLLAEKLNAATGYHIVSDVSSQPHAPEGTILFTTPREPAAGRDEGYVMEVLPKTISIEASTAAGALYAVQTLRQLFPPDIENRKPFDSPTPWTVPAVHVEDAPKFRWRGLLFDSCRHFAGKDFILKTLDLLAFHKLNRFHWHLTDDQGWRIEIERYPQLTQIGAYRTGDDGRRYGGYYTKDDVREIVKYASDRAIVVVPEIEMPGHCTAALASYPDLSCTGKTIPVATKWGIFEDVYCAGNEKVFEFLGNVLAEVAELFPGKYIHIGGDETPTARWEACRRCRKRMEEEQIGDVKDLQVYFMNRVERILAALGRRPIGWDEILAVNLATSTTVQAWRGRDKAASAARLGYETIVSPTSHVYFDYGLDKIDLEKAYEFDPVPPGLPPLALQRVLGGECAMWTEHAPRDRIESKLYPRLVAFAERMWSGAGASTFEDFHRRLQTHYKRLKLLGVDYGPESDTNEK